MKGALLLLATVTLLPFVHMASLSPRIKISGAGVRQVNGIYTLMDKAQIPSGFSRTCMAMGWDSQSTWEELSAGMDWYEAPNKAYLYLHKDRRWWLDGPTGAGEYVAPACEDGALPTTGWQLLGGMEPLPMLEPFEDGDL